MVQNPDEVWVVDSRWPRDRGRAKIRYARLSLEEVRKHGARGDDFDYAHEEACLAHLDSVVDVFLQEVNVCLKLGLDLWDVNRLSIAKTLGRVGVQCLEFDELAVLLEDKTSWLSEAREFRNHGVHRAPVSRNYIIVVGDSSKVQFRNPRTGVVQQLDRLDVIAGWIDRAEELFERLGASLRNTCGLPTY
ncbi:MAG: hypothetical protein WDO56_32650 [Gammaproteobacteria bacterium]